MKPAFLLPLLLAGCATTPQAYAPVSDVRYTAIGADPFWLLSIGDDRIVLRTASAEEDAVWPRPLPRTVDGARIWESSDGTTAISIETRPGPCTGAGGQTYEDNVRVRLSGRELAGCGGPLTGRSNN